jgi:hypothetical protein
MIDARRVAAASASLPMVFTDTMETIAMSVLLWNDGDAEVHTEKGVGYG